MKLVSLQDATSPLVLALDIGTSSTRALVFDALAQQLDETESQVRWELTETDDGGLVADADALVELVCGSVDQSLSLAGVRATDIAAVSASCFWHGLLLLGEHMQPVSPVLMWIDSRSAAVARTIRDQEPDLATRMLRETGCRPHSSYWPAKIRWLQQRYPEQFSAARYLVSFTDYLQYRLTGELFSSVGMASGTGFLNLSTNAWHLDLADEFGVTGNALVPLTDRGEALPPLFPEFRDRWPQLANVPWYPALGDGAAANLGAGCIGSDRIAMTIGTSAAMRIVVPIDSHLPPAPETLWEYRLDRSNRVIGGALSNGGNVTGWLADLLAGGDFERISSEAAEIAPDSHGLTWLPFFAGERSPSWDDLAAGSVLGLRLHTTRGELFRAGLEAVSYRLATVYTQLSQVAAEQHTIHANGGAALSSPLWMSIIADAFGHELLATDAETEVSGRGAAISALETLGVWQNLRPDHLESTKTFGADASVTAIYREAGIRQTVYEGAIRRAGSQF